MANVKYAENVLKRNGISFSHVGAVKRCKTFDYSKVGTDFDKLTAISLGMELVIIGSEPYLVTINSYSPKIDTGC